MRPDPPPPRLAVVHRRGADRAHERVVQHPLVESRCRHHHVRPLPLVTHAFVLPRPCPRDRVVERVVGEVADLRCDQVTCHGRGEARQHAVDGERDPTDPTVVLAHELQVPAQTGHVLPARHGAGVEDDAGHRLVGRQPRVDGCGERIEVDPAQRCRGLDDHRARLLVEADGDARGLGQRGEPRRGLGAVTLGEDAHRAGHEEAREAGRLPDPRDVADDGARVEQVQRAGAEPQVLPQRARGEAPVVGTHLAQDPQPSPRTLRLVEHRHDDAVVLVAGQNAAGADADHAGRHIRQDLDHVGASSQRGTGFVDRHCTPITGPATRPEGPR